MDILSTVMLADRIWPLGACCSLSPFVATERSDLDLLPESITKSKGLRFVLGMLATYFVSFYVWIGM